jgi:hypothetical protein
MQHAVKWTGKAGDVACIRPTDTVGSQGRGRAADGSYSMPADEQGQGRDGQKKQDRRWNRQPADR